MTEAQLSNAMDAYGSTVYRLALTRMQNIADAEDVYQEVFLRLWKQAAEEWDGDRAKAWLIRTTLNRCADLHRFHLRRPVSERGGNGRRCGRRCALPVRWLWCWGQCGWRPVRQRNPDCPSLPTALA